MNKGSERMETLAQVKAEIAKYQGTAVDIIYHPHSSYRMIKQGGARIGALFPHFFEVEIQTKEFGSYKTTITYLDVYTKSCIIQPHQKNQPEG